MLLLFLLQQVSCFLAPAPEPGMFRAAVYEHELVLPWDCTQRLCTRQEAIVAMEVNLRVLREQVVEAASKGANIILLPEDAIHGFGFSREFLWPFLEYVPSLADGSNPCLEDGDQDNWLLRELSCAALENSIYIAADMATKVPGCEHCDNGGECFFNTLVVLDDSGRLVAVYHKFNLWTSELGTFDIDVEGPQLVTVDTPFGRLGLAICADLIWKSPITDLAEQEGIDTLLLPLSW